MLLALTDQLRTVWDVRCELVAELLALPSSRQRRAMFDAIEALDTAYDDMLDGVEQAIQAR